MDLSTVYLGLKLRNPLVVAACPLGAKVETILELEAAGAAAVVLPSLFEEQIEGEEIQLHQLYEFQSESFAESLTHFPELEQYNTGPDEYLRHIENVKQQAKIPIIASLNGSTTRGWVRYARLIEAAGADALELNVYLVPTQTLMSAQDIENRYVDLVSVIRESISLPLAVKIGAQFSSLPNFSRQLVTAGANGLVLFNRYLEPDIDLEALEFRPDLALSGRHEIRLPLRWIAILRDELTASLAATSGVKRAEDVVKSLLVGADVAQVAAAILAHGSSWISETLEEVNTWLVEREYASVEQMKGSMSRGNCPNPSDLERANYMKAITSYSSEHPF